MADRRQHFRYTHEPKPHNRSAAECMSKEISMGLPSITLRNAAWSLAIIMLFLNPAAAQTSASGCALQPIGGTSRQLLRCQGGLTVVAEPGARYSLVDRNRDRKVDGIRLQSK